jgi:hypothetical protein
MPPERKQADNAVEGRYPGFDEPVSEEEYLDAIVKAKRVLQWAHSIVENAKHENKAPLL